MANQIKSKRRDKRRKATQKAKFRGGSDFNVHIREQTSLMKGGKKHSRKYLKPRRKSGGSYMGFSQLSMTPVQQIAPMTSYKV